MGPVVGPFARGGDPFAGRNRRGMAHRGDAVAMAAGLDTEHAETGLGVVEGYPLDEAGQHLAAGGCGRPHLRAMPALGGCVPGCGGSSARTHLRALCHDPCPLFQKSCFSALCPIPEILNAQFATARRKTAAQSRAGGGGGDACAARVPPAQSRTMSEMGRVVAAMPDSVPG